MAVLGSLTVARFPVAATLRFEIRGWRTVDAIVVCKIYLRVTAETFARATLQLEESPDRGHAVDTNILRV